MFLKKQLEKVNENKFEIIYWLFVVFLIFIMGFKNYSVGTDSIVYEHFFEKIANGNMNVNNDTIEIGYSFLCFILAKMGLNYLGFQIVVSIFINLTFAFFIKKVSSNKILSIILYVFTSFYFYAFNAVRQCLAIAIVLYGIWAILKDKKKLWWVYLLTVVLALTFHKSSFLFLPAMSLFYVKLNWKLTLLIFSGVGIIMCFSQTIFNFINNHFDFFYTEKYINTELFNQRADTKSILLTLAYVTILIASFIYEKIMNSEMQNSWIKNFFIAFVLMRFASLFGCFPYLILRFSDLFAWIMILYVLEIINITKTKTLRFVLIGLIVVAYFLLMIFQVFIFKNANIIPYSFVF